VLRKLGFFTGFWWVALRERDPWLEQWIGKKSARPAERLEGGGASPYMDI
jgi:hypothetical protein